MNPTDPRLKIAELTLEGFLGPSFIRPASDPCDVLLGTATPEFVLTTCKEWEMLNPKDDFGLYVNESQNEPEVFILCGTKGTEPKIVGLYRGQTLCVENSYRKPDGSLSRELILAAFGQWPWKDKARQFTASGVRAFIRAYDYIKYR